MMAITRAFLLMINLRIDLHLRRRVSRPAGCSAYLNHYWKVAAIYCRGKRQVNLFESRLIQQNHICWDYCRRADRHTDRRRYGSADARQMDFEHCGHQGAGAIVRGDVERLCHTTRRRWIGDITDYRASARTVGVSENIGLRRYNRHLTSYHRAIAIYHDWIACRSGARYETYGYDKTDRRCRNRIDPTSRAVN